MNRLHPIAQPLTALLLALGAATAARAQTAPPAVDMRAAAYLAATCANCHGTAGRPATGNLPPLAGMSRDGMVRAMRDYRDGRRNATIMHQLAKGYTDEQIDQLAAYFAAQKAP